MAKSRTKRTRSNKTTQNPKGNQEKTADEGIQKHSEHTAENKQPESEENAAKNDDAAKQAEMKQADTVEQPKEQRKLSDHLETISKLIGILTVLSILFGGFVIYIYLLKIDQLSILPEVISNPSNLIAAITIFITIFIIIILLYYLSSHLLSKLILFFIKLFQVKQKFRNPKFPTPIKFDEILLELTYIIILSFLIWISSNFLKTYLEYLFPQTDNNNIYVLFIPLVFLILRNYLRDNFFEPPYSNFFINILTIIVILMCLILLALSNKISVLNFTHFIEIPENSSWYLLHNNFQQNNGSQEVNGIDKNDLIKLKQNFKCSILSEEEKAEKNIECSSIPEQRNNALYGYMAWNLGDTKVFCPPTTDNTKIDDIEKWKIPAEKLGKECIIISGKALQIMPESYISTNTDGIDDGNPENTGHDNPAIDINTDVRFKNDLNAQSNAGLNNFNVQPVLPIQSDAKNMSIQINYGNCNHDSPRNKDGHPDIGYTDKKICQ